MPSSAEVYLERMWKIIKSMFPAFNESGDDAGWTVIGTSSANTQKEISKAAQAGRKHYVEAFEVIITGAAAASTVTVQLKDGTTVKWQTYIGNGAAIGTRVGMVFASPIQMSVNSGANLVASAGGASVVTTLNLKGFTSE